MSADSNPRWFFVKQDPNDRIRATARRHSLGGTGLSPESRLAREVIQNSVDATLPNKKTDVLIWKKTLSGQEVLNFRNLIGFDDSDSPFTRLDKLGLKVGTAFTQMKSKSKSPSFSVTLVEDRNTCGLCYDASDGKDRFDELCLSYGQDSTAAAAERGGSYGFGKGVYEESSDCNTFIVYSVYKPNPISPSDPGSHARLFACSTFDGHTVENTDFKGRALFGVHREIHGQTECRPILDADAHRIARQLGFLERGPTEYGTSIMIIGSTIELDALRTAVEDYWWPRIYSNQLSVLLWEDDDPIKSPEPREREDLKPYLRCYSLIEEKMAPDEEEKLFKFHPASGSTAQPGQLALKPLAQADEDSMDDAASDTDLDSTVALIRSGPKMVVEYLDPGGRAAANFAGVFLSHPDVEQELHLSEPPAHDSWAPNSPRLSEAYAEDPAKMEAAQWLVESILNRIKSKAREFRRDLVPAPLPPVVTGSRTLQNILARIMSTPSVWPPPPPPRPASANPFNLRIREGRKNFDGHSRVTASIEISLSENAPSETAEVVVSVEPYMVMDDDMKKDASGVIALESAHVDGVKANIRGDSDIHVNIAKDKTVELEIESAIFDRDQYAGLEVEVDLKKGWDDGAGGDSEP